LLLPDWFPIVIDPFCLLLLHCVFVDCCSVVDLPCFTLLVVTFTFPVVAFYDCCSLLFCLLYDCCYVVAFFVSTTFCCLIYLRCYVVVPVYVCSFLPFVDLLRLLIAGCVCCSGCSTVVTVLIVRCCCSLIVVLFVLFVGSHVYRYVVVLRCSLFVRLPLFVELGGCSLFVAVSICYKRRLLVAAMELELSNAMATWWRGGRLAMAACRLLTTHDVVGNGCDNVLAVQNAGIMARSGIQPRGCCFMAGTT